MAILRRQSPFADGALTSGSAARRAPAAVIGWERILAPTCAILLLLYPHPLAVAAGVVGVLPSLARWLLHGRPWRATAFDLPLALLVIGTAVGYAVALEANVAAVRLTGFLAGLVVFAWLREWLMTPHLLYRSALWALVGAVVLGVLLLSVAAPFLVLGRVPPLAMLAAVLEPLSLYRPLVGDEAILQRFRLYASGVGALADVGLALTAGVAIGAVNRRWRLLLVLPALFFACLLLVSDSRGSILAAALTLGLIAACWRPRLLWVLPLVLFGTFDLIALGLVQRGLNLRTVLERADFWMNGLALGAETALSGVGLGVRSVQLAYRAAYQPVYPPFFHAHNIYVQAFLEQGVLGLVGLLGLTVAVLVLGARVRRVPDWQARGAGIAAFGVALALLTCGLTEVVALTTFGWTLLCAALGFLVASVDGASVGLETRPRMFRLGLRVPLPNRAVVLTALVAVLIVGGVSGLRQAGLALVMLNAGTIALYRATLAEGLSRDDQARALTTATRALSQAVALDADDVAARRNLALADAAGNGPSAARRHADEALALASPNDRRELFGVGRAYVAAEAWPEAIQTWEQAGAGPQLLRLGGRLARGRSWPAGIEAYLAAARLDAPGRSAVDGITRTALDQGETPDEAVARLRPLIDAGGRSAYKAELQTSQVYRQAGRPDDAWAALQRAAGLGPDAQYDLERALLDVSLGRLSEAEPGLQRASAEINQAVTPVAEGSDPRYWLAYVEAEQGKYQQAVEAARRGLADLPPEQASLRAPYLVLLGDSLLALGRPAEALSAYQEGQRVAPNDGRFADGIARARVALTATMP